MINGIELQERMKDEGFELTNEEAEIMAEAVNTALRKQEFEDDRCADVAAYCHDLRAVGMWNGD